MKDPLKLKNFRRWGVAIDTRPFLKEVGERNALWLANTRRQKEVGVQRETQAIHLRIADKSQEPDVATKDVHACRPTDLWPQFPHHTDYLEKFAERRAATLQRA